MSFILYFQQILFLKAPEPGQVKKRLAASIGYEAAANIYAAMLCKQVAEFIDAKLYTGGGSDKLIRECLKGILSENEYSLYAQKGVNLGARMQNAFVESCGNEDHAILLAGTDVPEYTQAVAALAAEKLENHDCVIVPSNDGGYSAIGFRSKAIRRNSLKGVFENITWSTDSVLHSQCANLEKLNYSVYITEPVCDVDTIEDLLSYIKRSGDTALRQKIPGVALIIPVLNEEDSLPRVLSQLPREMFQHIVVADNNSTDRSRQIAIEHGCSVTVCEEKGYGATCLKALSYLYNFNDWNYVIFLDADGSDDPDDLFLVMSPVLRDHFDFSLGKRKPVEGGALQPHQKWGNWLATRLIQLFWGVVFDDLGPLRCLKRSSFIKLNMDDRNFGWTIQMQIRAAKQNMNCIEVPVAYRKRIAGKSKVSGNLKGSFLAGVVILRTVWRELFLAEEKGSV